MISETSKVKTIKFGLFESSWWFWYLLSKCTNHEEDFFKFCVFFRNFFQTLPSKLVNKVPSLAPAHNRTTTRRNFDHLHFFQPMKSQLLHFSWSVVLWLFERSEWTWSKFRRMLGRRSFRTNSNGLGLQPSIPD